MIQSICVWRWRCKNRLNSIDQAYTSSERRAGRLHVKIDGVIVDIGRQHTSLVMSHPTVGRIPLFQIPGPTLIIHPDDGLVEAVWFFRRNDYPGVVWSDRCWVCKALGISNSTYYRAW